jgi:serine/threonine-protein kinase
MGKITASQFKLTVPDLGAADAVDSGWGDATQDAAAAAGEATQITPAVEQRVCPDCGVTFSSPDATFCPFDGARLLVASAPDHSDPLLGAVLADRYQVLTRLGEGGMGAVYRVTHTTLGKQFAVKVLRGELARDAELSQRFIREARAMAQINNPNVIQVTDFGELDDGRPFFVMELLSGRSLSSLLREQGVAPSVALIVARHVAEALAAAHNSGIIHRDLKPDNVYVDPESWQVKVLDFGLAYVVGSSRLTQRGVVFGTPQYMSPEQASGGAVDHRSDIYALGIVLYEMLAGRVPFEADSYMGVLTKQMYTPPAPLPPVVLDREPLAPGVERPELAREIDALVQRCLAKNPEQRFASMPALMSALDQVMWHLPNGAAAAAPGLPSNRPGEAAAGLRSAVWRAAVRRPGVLLWGLGGLSFLIGMGLWGWHSSAGTPHLPADTPRAVAPAAVPPATVPPTVLRRPVVRPVEQASAASGSSSVPAVASSQASPPQNSPRKPRSKSARAAPAPQGKPATSAAAPSPANPLSNADLIDPWSQQ